MKNILIITGSVRKVNVNEKIVKLVEQELGQHSNLNVNIADLSDLALPFYDAPTPPSSDEYVIPHESVRKWSDMVTEADAVIFIVPEYNHSLSAIQKNSIDWLFKEWAEKPVAFVAYGWYGGVHSLAQLAEISTVVKWRAQDKNAQLRFMQELEVDGSLKNPEEVKKQITEVVDQLVDSLD